MRFLNLLLATAFCLSSCSRRTGDKDDTTMSTKDAHSFARPEEALVRHLDLNLKVDFSNQELSGTATLQIDNLSKGSQLHLDTRDLRIDSILLDDGSTAKYDLMPAVPYLGSELVVYIKPTTKKITIAYRTSPQAAALQWLKPEQTAGGKQPFLFTQSQAILARTWIPIQDSPGIRFTYTARVSCPAGLMALMSAENDTVLHPDGVYTFKMPQAIPAYLMALAVGDLRFHPYDERSGVFAEPVTLDKATYEFADLPKMITAAEELYGPYAWGRYDVLVLPPSFPFGGMENPRLTFATPTIIAGDRSLVALIAHELAHSWSGNLVTNATWNDFWLNEGFTVYFEARIMEKLYGKEYEDMATVLAEGELRKTVAALGEDNPDTRLYLNLEGRDPDDGMSDIAYEKGRFFLLNIERAVGRERWDAFLKQYFAEHAFQSIHTEQFLTYLEENLIQGDGKLRNTKIRDNKWVFGTGLPDSFPKVHSAELEKAQALAADFAAGKTIQNPQGWTTHHWVYFLRQLPAQLSPAQMEDLDRRFQFTGSGNSEILCQWLEICIRNQYTKADASLERFLTSVGRRKFLKPLYTALAATPSGKEKARAIYAKARPGYHSVSSGTIDELLR
ncbi:MAG: M1 family metallopeptidase [Bacteroidia bacterium]|nr:M1 family metallopeptidase [Bacteroidia bacterium]